MPEEAPAAAGFGFHFSTDALPKRDRMTIWREEFGRRLCRCDFEPQRDHIYADFTLRALPDFKLMSFRHAAMRAARTRALIADGNDDLVLQIAMSGCAASHLGREFEVSAGDGFLSSNADAGDYIMPIAASHCLLLSFSRDQLRAQVRDVDAVVARPLGTDTPAFRLLKGYIGVFGEVTSLPPELGHSLVTHVYDLVATALGATGDVEAIARGRGLRAARLRAAKTYVLHNLASFDLSAATLAAQLGVTPRYVHMLFETEKESFTEFILSHRLARSRRMLRDPRFDQLTISAIALDAGFADLSHFNRSFRRRFGATPSQVRKQTQHEGR